MMRRRVRIYKQNIHTHTNVALTNESQKVSSDLSALYIYKFPGLNEIERVAHSKRDVNAKVHLIVMGRV